MLRWLVWRCYSQANQSAQYCVSKYCVPMGAEGDTYTDGSVYSYSTKLCVFDSNWPFWRAHKLCFFHYITLSSFLLYFSTPASRISLPLDPKRLSILFFSLYFFHPPLWIIPVNGEWCFCYHLLHLILTSTKVKSGRTLLWVSNCETRDRTVCWRYIMTQLPWGHYNRVSSITLIKNNTKNHTTDSTLCLYCFAPLIQPLSSSVCIKNNL